MATPGYVICLLLLSFHLSYNYEIVRGMDDATTEFDEQLKILNKPPIKTIKGNGGELYDCIDIRKQPAFDHPLLKNHEIQMRPKFIPKKSVHSNNSSSRSKLESLGLIGGGCPKGSVPIRRTTKEDLVRAEAFNELFGPQMHQGSKVGVGEHVALISTGSRPNFIYNGVQGHLSVHNPSPVASDSNSAAYIYVQNIPANEIMLAGWMVAPGAFGDSRTRTFIYWSNGKSGCTNLLCSGFVQVDPKYPLGHVLEKESGLGGPLFEMTLAITKDKESPRTPTWWLTSVDQSIQYGYWPGELFPSSTQGGAPTVGWAGGVRSPVDQPCSPPMGSGFFPDSGFYRGAFISHMKFIDGSFEVKDADYRLKFTDKPNCYAIVDKGYIEDDGIGYSMVYGGPGGQC